jgi:hypothetical protein
VSNHGRDGKFVKGNRAHVKTALRAKALPPEMEHLVVQERDDYQQAIADDGGPSEIIRRRAQAHENRQRVQRRIRQLEIALDRFGLFDHKGHLRVAWLQQLVALIGRAESLDRLLTLERRARVVDPDDVGAYIAQRSEGQ